MTIFEVTRGFLEVWKWDGISRRLFKFIGDLSMEKTINGTYFFFERFFFFFSFQKSEESFPLVAWLLFRRMIGLGEAGWSG